MITPVEKRAKTFPLEIEDGLHKALKMLAIQEDKSLHTLIIETLEMRVEQGTNPRRKTRKTK